MVLVYVIRGSFLAPATKPESCRKGDSERLRFLDAYMHIATLESHCRFLQRAIAAMLGQLVLRRACQPTLGATALVPRGVVVSSGRGHSMVLSASSHGRPFSLKSWWWMWCQRWRATGGKIQRRSAWNPEHREEAPVCSSMLARLRVEYVGDGLALVSKVEAVSIHGTPLSIDRGRCMEPCQPMLRRGNLSLRSKALVLLTGWSVQIPNIPGSVQSVEIALNARLRSRMAGMQRCVLAGPSR